MLAHGCDTGTVRRRTVDHNLRVCTIRLAGRESTGSVKRIFPSEKSRHRKSRHLLHINQKQAPYIATTSSLSCSLQTTNPFPQQFPIAEAHLLFLRASIVVARQRNQHCCLRSSSPSALQRWLCDFPIEPLRSVSLSTPT